MPVYVRKNLLSITPPSLSELISDDDDFLTDPEQLHDQLPQPFRMIDKILNLLIDDAWETVSNREATRLEEKSRVRPPRYECAVQMQDFGTANCMTDSKDGRYIFIGMPNGVVVIDAATQSKVTVWEEEGVDITSINVSLVSVQMYLLSTVDDMGVARLLFCAYEGLHLLKVLNENEGGTKTIASKCQPSNEGDYAAVTLESGTDCWIEIHKLPRDNWIREFEAAHSHLLKQQHPPKAPSPHDKQEGEGTEGGVDGNNPTDVPATASSLEALDKKSIGSRSQSPSSPKAQSPRASPTPTTSGNVQTAQINIANLSKPSLVLRIKPPTPLTGSNASSAYSVFKAIDDGSVIGTGSNHALLTHHLELRKAAFNVHHERDLQYLQKAADGESTGPRQYPNLVFLNAGRMLAAGLDSAATTGRPNSVAVYWTGSTNLYHYNLLKTAKDIEHKADMVWPNACPVSAIATSQCTSLIALGFEDGSVVAWDKYIGVPITSYRATTTGSVNYVRFLNPGILAQSLEDYPPYPTPRASGLLVGCTDGTLCLVPCGRGSDDLSVITLSGRQSSNDDLYSLIEPLPAIPHVILTVKQNSEAMLHDISKCQTLCEITLPQTHKMTSPWTPVLAIGAEGQMMYVRGTQLDPNEDYVPNSGLTSLFVFQLRSFPTLDKYWKRLVEAQPYIVHVTADKRVEDLLAERLSQQSVRQVRMQDRWYKLRSEVENVQKYKEIRTTGVDNTENVEKTRSG
ncbi:WD repeat-containing protein 93-like isoform X2 [Ptychodera flava]|uniref:WD repeat-containing protein 93-like isoform X2 n=1 Tax=Ptychodera flava TaxID=63121 RepID=UPI00396A1BF2